ncbi:hypothetical protein IW492_13025 [Enterococcus sp. BWB1-3]|nr:hypothetical protein [Enterococcus sp. BWB1-3]MBL1230154.1 hypothetical protein [Enterococcus sp. BWB1-3]
MKKVLNVQIIISPTQRVAHDKEDQKISPANETRKMTLEKKYRRIKSFLP